MKNGSMKVKHVGLLIAASRMILRAMQVCLLHVQSAVGQTLSHSIKLVFANALKLQLIVKIHPSLRIATAEKSLVMDMSITLICNAWIWVRPTHVSSQPLVRTVVQLREALV